MLPTKFRVNFGRNWLSVQKKKPKIDFQDGRHLGFPIGTILAIRISTSHLNASYQFSNQLALWFRKISESYFQKRVSRVLKRVSRRPPWISDPNNLSYFRFTSHPNATYQVSNQMAFQFRRRSEKQIFK